MLFNLNIAIMWMKWCYTITRGKHWTLTKMPLLHYNVWLVGWCEKWTKPQTICKQNSFYIILGSWVVFIQNIINGKKPVCVLFYRSLTAIVFLISDLVILTLIRLMHFYTLPLSGVRCINKEYIILKVMFFFQTHSLYVYCICTLHNITYHYILYTLI